MKLWALDHKEFGRFYLTGVINILKYDTVF
jgi:hypothetical protein